MYQQADPKGSSLLPFGGLGITLCRVMSTCTLGLPPPIFSVFSLMLTMLLLTTSCSFGGVASLYLICTQQQDRLAPSVRHLSAYSSIVKYQYDCSHMMTC